MYYIYFLQSSLGIYVLRRFISFLAEIRDFGVILFKVWNQDKEQKKIEFWRKSYPDRRSSFVKLLVVRELIIVRAWNNTVIAIQYREFLQERRWIRRSPLLHSDHRSRQQGTRQSQTYTRNFWDSAVAVFACRSLFLSTSAFKWFFNFSFCWGHLHSYLRIVSLRFFIYFLRYIYLSSFSPSF